MTDEVPRPANILIVEDDHVYAQRVIAPHFEDDWPIHIAYNVPQSLEALDDIVDLKLAVVDLDIPGGRLDVKESGGAGFEVMSAIKERFPAARIVVLTNHLTPMLVNKAQQMKAEYIAKGDCARNLRGLADDLMREEQSEHSDPAVRVAQEIAEQCGLTEKQREVLILLVRSYSRDEIGKELGITHWTLKSHIREIVRRTGFSRTQELLRKIRKQAAAT